MCVAERAEAILAAALMRIRHLLTVSAVAAIVAVPSAATADDFADACRRFASARVVFIGQVTGLPVRRHVSSQELIERFQRKWSGAEADMAKRNVWPLPLDFVLTPMRVETAFRNIETADVYVLTERPDELQLGRSYLVYGHHAIDQALPDILRATVLVTQPDPNGEEIRFLNLARTQKFSAAIYGSLILHDFPAQIPLAGVPIRFTVGDQRFEAITNGAGRFIATGIPAGNISVEPLLPAGLSFDTLPNWYVAMPDGGCSELHLRASKNRRIRGRVLHPDGSPLARASVELAPLRTGASELQTQYTVETNDSGEFEFRGLSARTYVMGINLTSLPTSRAPYTATYYPTPLEIGDATQLDDIEWVLDAPLPTGEIEVVVDGGRGSSDIISACAVPLAEDGHRHGLTRLEVQNRRGPEPLTIPIVEGIRYRLIARASRGNGNVDSEPVEIVGAAGRQAVTLRLGSPARPEANVCEAAF
jgi:hypothetical protein